LFTSSGMRSRIPACAALLGLLLLATACGQRGPLYLPGDPDEGRVVIPGTEPAQEEEEQQASDEDEPREPPL
jgi:predicted small lipoprotein YifL